MVMSGSAERVVFVHDRPGQESLLTGGTIARLRSDNAEVVVLFGSVQSADDSAVQAAMAALDVSDWRMLPAASGAQVLAEAVADVLDDVLATAVVIGADDDTLRTATAGAADSLNVPVFVHCRVTDAAGQRLVAIDVSAQVDQKLRAIAAYPHRWSVTDHTVEPVDAVSAAVPEDPADRPVTIGGTETFLRRPATHAAAADATPGLLSRVLAAGFALLTGAAFGVLGTIAHQATLSLGPVTIPIGLILALGGITALLAGLRLVLGDRTVVFFCAIGLLGTIFVLSLRSAGGSVLVPQGMPGLLWTVVPTLVATIVLAWPRIPARPGSA
jgi:LmbE family N-acetylglucosaminyl deacetylase